MKGYMSQDYLKTFLKAVRRSQSQLKYSLFFVLLIVLAVATGYTFSRKLSLPSVRDDIKIGSVSDSSASTEPTSIAATPTPSPVLVAPAKTSQKSVVKQKSAQMQKKTYVTQKKNKAVKVVAKKHVVTKKQVPVAVKAQPQLKKSSTYVVKKGDSLWKISQKTYKTGHQWTTIYRANHKVIGSNPRLIYPNTHLVIPHR
jgi:nucleoid-associated protein YgaU